MSWRSCKVQFNNTDGQVEGRESEGREGETKQELAKGQWVDINWCYTALFVLIWSIVREEEREREKNRQLDNGQV